MTALGTTDAGDLLSIDLDALVGSHACVVANSGGGKSGLLRRLLETTHGRIQHVVLDPEDEFYTLREHFDYVIAGGDGGDVPATVEGAAGLALAALTHGFSLIVQLNDLDETDPDDPTRHPRAEFVRNFLSALINAPRHLWHPALVAIDEVQLFAPSDRNTPASGAVRQLTSRGRKRGFTAVLASQRISKVNADVRGDINNWMLGRVGQTLDRDIMADQLGFTRAQGRERLRMEDRTFWGLGPAIAGEPVLFRVADVQTTLVKSGQAKVPTPPAPEALRAILAGLVVPTTESDAADDLDAKLLRGAEVRQLREARDAFEQRALRAEDLLAGLLKSTDMFQQSLREAMEMWGYVDVHLFGAKEHIEANGWQLPGDSEFDVEASLADVSPEAIRAVIDQQPTKQVTEPQKTAVSRPQAASETSKSSPSPAAAEMPHGVVAIAAGAKKMIAALAKHYPRMLPIEHVAKIAGVSMKSSQWPTNFREFRLSPLVAAHGDEWRMSPTGVMRFGLEAQPDDPAALLDFWVRGFPPSIGAMLKILVAERDWLSREEIAERAGISIMSSGLGSGLKELRDNGLAEQNHIGAHRAKTVLL